jgi:hypothetical protein
VGDRGPPMDYEELKRWTRVTIACGVLVGRKPDAFSAPGRSAARGPRSLIHAELFPQHPSWSELNTWAGVAEERLAINITGRNPEDRTLALSGPRQRNALSIHAPQSGSTDS